MKSAASILDVLDELLQRIAAIQTKAAFSLVRIGSNDLDTAPRGVLLDRVGLVLGRVFLVLGGHADILRSTP